jgi:hypothetical protein
MSSCHNPSTDGAKIVVIAIFLSLGFKNCCTVVAAADVATRDKQGILR